MTAGLVVVARKCAIAFSLAAMHICHMVLFIFCFLINWDGRDLSQKIVYMVFCVICIF